MLTAVVSVDLVDSLVCKPIEAGGDKPTGTGREVCYGYGSSVGGAVKSFGALRFGVDSDYVETCFCVRLATPRDASFGEAC